jgi:hypothetical protein
MGSVKTPPPAVWELSTQRPNGPATRFPSIIRSDHTSLQEFAMADLAFVLTVLAGFALVALVARGVTKL